MLSAMPAPTVAVASPRRARFDRYSVLFWLLLLLFEAFIFTLPLFPNGDGPVHIYLSSIFWKLATHSSPLYEHFYDIRHLVQPYSFQYYLMILLGHIMRADTAEKCFVGLIWATLAVGFRALVGALAQVSVVGTAAESAASLLIFPLLFNWPLSAGFFNFTFGCGLLLFALACYTRLGSPGRVGPPLGALLVTLVLLVLAHPIPILVFLCLGGLDQGLQWLGGWQRPKWGQVAGLALACVAFLFPVLIADKAAVAGSINRFGLHFDLLQPLALGYSVSYFQVQNIFGWLYQLLIVCMLPASVLLAIRAGLLPRLRQGSINAADRLLLSALIFLTATLVLPESMNGSAFFAVRMWFIVWLAAAACAVSALEESRLQTSVTAFSTALASLCLIFGLLYVRPVARRQAALEHAPLPANQRGLFFQPASGAVGKETHTWWALAFWDGVRAFSAHGDVLLNTPWLQLTIVPVQERGRAGLMRDVTPVSFSENPNYALEAFQQHPELKDSSLALADFLLFADPNNPAPNPSGFAENFLGPLAKEWTCAPHDFYAICTRASRAGH